MQLNGANAIVGAKRCEAEPIERSAKALDQILRALIRRECCEWFRELQLDNADA